MQLNRRNFLKATAALALLPLANKIPVLDADVIKAPDDNAPKPESASLTKQLDYGGNYPAVYIDGTRVSGVTSMEISIERDCLFSYFYGQAYRAVHAPNYSASFNGIAHSDSLSVLDEAACKQAVDLEIHTRDGVVIRGDAVFNECDSEGNFSGVFNSDVTLSYNGTEKTYSTMTRIRTTHSTLPIYHNEI